MSDDDPFAEDSDTERTVIRPNPAGRRPHTAPQAAPAALAVTRQTETPNGAEEVSSSRRAGDSALEAGMTGTNPLNAAATILFSLVSRIRNRAQHMDPDALRRSVVAEVRAFEARALQARVNPQDIKVARYAICATIDDVVLNTPWGGNSTWGQQSMVGTFHRETVGGDRFYDLLARLEQDPARNIEVLEFLYMCLSLGFEGRLRVQQGGADRHASIRSGLANIIRAQRGLIAPGLSPNYAGVDLPHRAISAWKPFWISLSAMGALLGTGFIGLSWALSVAAGTLTGQLSALGSDSAVELNSRPLPVVTPPVETEQRDRITKFLEAEIEEGLVSVFQDANTITVRINGKNMFASGSDVMSSDFEVPLERVAAALKETSGPVIVAGHSDNQPIKSARFPSNMHLSLARAETVRTALAGLADDPGRLTAEGRADKQPIASNETPDGRAINRRIEIIFLRERSQ